MNPATLRMLPPQENSDGIPHLAGPASEARQVLAAHFLRGIDHILEIGGHLLPITAFLTHAPRSVTSIDPKTPPLEAEELNGRPCRVRHIARKFQQVELDYEPGSYALVMLGCSLKPFGSQDAVGQRLLRLVDNARRVVLDYAPALDRAMDAVPQLLGRPGLTELCSFELVLKDPAIAASPYAARRLHVLERKFSPGHG